MLIGGEKYKKMKKKKKTHEQYCIVLYPIKQGHIYSSIPDVMICRSYIAHQWYLLK
jgi:hypothetical protein